MGKGEEDQVGIICTGLDKQRWHLDQGDSCRGEVTRDITEPASLADRLDEAMSEREASRMTPWGAIARGKRRRRGWKSRVLFYSVVTIEVLDYKGTCHRGRWTYGSHWKSQVLAPSKGVIYKS